MNTINVIILLYDNVEILDFTGPLEVFYRARLATDDAERPGNLFTAITVAQSYSPVKTFGGLSIIPDKKIDEIDKSDILLIPGGPGARKMIMKSPEVLFVKENIQSFTYIATVCTGAWICGLAGVSNGHKITTHHNRYYSFEKLFPNTMLIRNQKYIDDGKIISSGGISSGIDLGLYLVYKFFGKEVLQRTADLLEYNFQLRNEDN